MSDLVEFEDSSNWNRAVKECEECWALVHADRMKAHEHWHYKLKNPHLD